MKINKCQSWEHSNPSSKEVKHQLPGRKCGGLCTYCANRSTCTIPRPKGGLLYCDEFDNGWW